MEMNRKLLKNEYETKVRALSVEIVNFIKSKDDLTDGVILGSLCTLMNTFCKFINMKEDDHEVMMREISIIYKNDLNASPGE